MSEVGLLSGITAQEHAEMSATKPRGPYLYIRAATARAHLEEELEVVLDEVDRRS